MASTKRKSRGALPGVRLQPKRRPARVADIIKSEVSTLLLHKVNDPRLQRVTVTAVKVTDDLRLAIVYYSVSAEISDDVKAGLNSAKGFIRSRLARGLNMRYVPELNFSLDTDCIKDEKMEQLFKEIRGTAENG